MASVRLTRAQCANDDLPPICAKCGAEDTRLVARTFTWCPGWVIVFIFLSLPVLLIVYFVVRKKMTVRVPLCEAHAGDWSRAALYGWSSVLFFIAVFIAGVAVVDDIGPAFLAVGGLGFVASLIAIAIWNTRLIRPTEITARDIRLVGVCEAFADEAEDRRDRHRGRGYEEYEDDDRRPARRRRDRYADDDDAYDDRR